ncbi:protein prenylyltransferase [Sarocladium strictum]
MESHGIARSSRPRTEEQRQQQLEKIRRYRDLEDSVRQKIAAKEYSRETFDITSKLLRLNPEYYTIWNVRRWCLESSFFYTSSSGSSHLRDSQTSGASPTPTPSSAASSTSPSATTPSIPKDQQTGKNGTTPEDGETQNKDVVTSELMFTVPLLMEYPKCYWLWNYRLWVLQQAVERLRTPVARAIWEEELGLVGKMLHRDRRNFHAWGYRRGVIAQLESSSLDGSSMVEHEFDYTTRMIHVDLSNFSAWHNRGQLIPRLLDERIADDAARRELLDKELALVYDGLNVGPEDQSLWYYLQFLMLNVIELNGPRCFTPNLSQADRTGIISETIANIRDLLEDYNDIKWIYESLIEYTLALAQVEDRQSSDEERGEIAEWLRTLRGQDPKRTGRWTDLEKGLNL